MPSCHPGLCPSRATYGAKIVRDIRAGLVCGRRSPDCGGRCGLHGDAGTSRRVGGKRENGEKHEGRKWKGKSIKVYNTRDEKDDHSPGMGQTTTFSTDQTKNRSRVCFRPKVRTRQRCGKRRRRFRNHFTRRFTSQLKNEGHEQAKRQAEREGRRYLGEERSRLRYKLRLFHATCGLIV